MLEDQDLRSIQEVRAKIVQAHEAFLKYREYTQEQVDQIIDRMAAVARAHSESLARLAVEETGYGNVRDKVAKNLLNCDLLHRVIRPMKTVGVIREDREQGVIEIAEPVGVVAAIFADNESNLDGDLQESHFPEVAECDRAEPAPAGRPLYLRDGRPCSPARRRRPEPRRASFSAWGKRRSRVRTS